ncbi:hypothetical protein [Acaricomes phytoseiuli]|uniref:hypothetical protein n=1 Tax=Acaricomes phytoseiuli TaxID=291968 RepID=UPI00035E34B3|nr:hypothetical protein [Acaricomes phytoseiuli]
MTLDPRDVKPELIGTPLRDAAVNPKESDFLPPINAGKPGEEGNPHGPNVISPGIHALEEQHPIRPGLVSSDPATQSIEETEHLLKHRANDTTDPAPEPTE